MHFREIANANFYTASEAKCRRWIEELVAAAPAADASGEMVAGIVPHAGWVFSGKLAARTFRALAASARPQTIIVFGTVHYPGVDRNAAYPDGSWETPIGSVEIDHELAARLARELRPEFGGGLVLDARAHDREHSIEVNLPFIKSIFPSAKIVPIAVPPRGGAAELGEGIGELTAGQPVIAVGSTDLTHYGECYLFTPRGKGPEAYKWMRENDRRILDLIESLDAEAIEPEVAAHRNACGPGATAATVGFARARKVTSGRLLDYTTSFDVVPDPEFRMAVGYASVVF